MQDFFQRMLPERLGEVRLLAFVLVATQPAIGLCHLLCHTLYFSQHVEDDKAMIEQNNGGLKRSLIETMRWDENAPTDMPSQTHTQCTTSSVASVTAGVALTSRVITGMPATSNLDVTDVVQSLYRPTLRLQAFQWPPVMSKDSIVKKFTVHRMKPILYSNRRSGRYCTWYSLGLWNLQSRACKVVLCRIYGLKFGYSIHRSIKKVLHRSIPSQPVQECSE